MTSDHIIVTMNLAAAVAFDVIIECYLFNLRVIYVHGFFEPFIDEEIRLRHRQRCDVKNA
jgi:hypothetical protein